MSRKRLDGAVQAYNDAAGSFESRVLVERTPAARAGRHDRSGTARSPSRSTRVPRVLKQAGLMGLPEGATTDDDDLTDQSVATKLKSLIPEWLNRPRLSNPLVPRTSSAKSSPNDLKERPARPSRQHALSAGAQRVSAHRPRQVDLPEFRRRRGIRRPLQPALRRHQPDEGRRRVRRLDSGGRALARVRLGRSDVLRVRLLRADVSLRGAADSRRQGVRRQPDGRRDPRVPRHADRAGPEQPAPRSFGRGEPRPVPADAGGRVSRRRARAAREDRHGVAQHEHAGSDAVPHPTRDASPHARYLVHLSDLRLRASDLGRHRRHHALAVHAGVRGPSAAVRLGGGQPRARRRRSAHDRSRSSSRA